MPRFRLPAKLESLPDVNAFIEQNIPDEFSAIRANVELVAEELLVNVFSYAYPDGMSGEAEIDIYVERVEGRSLLCFSVKDWGAPFNPFEETEEPDLTLDTESRPIGGLGVFLIKSVSARQTYSFEDGANLINVFFDMSDQG